MAKPIITLNGLKIVIMLGMLVIILSGIRVAADIIVPFILALFIAVVLNPVVQRTGQTSHTARNSGIIAHCYYCDANGVAISVFRYILKRACANAAAVPLFTGYPTQKP